MSSHHQTSHDLTLVSWPASQEGKPATESVNALFEQLEDMQTSLAQTVPPSVEFENQLSDIQEFIDHLQKSVTNHLQTLNESTTDHTPTDSGHDDAIDPQEIPSLSDHEVESLKAEVDGLRTALAEFKNDDPNKNDRAEIDKRNVKIEQLNHELSQLRNQHRKLKRQSESTNKTKAKQQDTIKELREQLRRSQRPSILSSREVDTLFSKSTLSEAEKKALRPLVKGLINNDSSTANDTLTKLIAAIAKISTPEDSETQSIAASDAWQKEKESLETQLEELWIINEQLWRNNEKLTNEDHRLSNSVNTKDREIKALNEKIKRLESANSGTKKNGAKKGDSVALTSENSDTISDLLDRLEDEESRHNHSNLRIKTLMQENEDLVIKLEEVMNQQSKLESMLSSTRDEHDILTEQFSELRELGEYNLQLNTRIRELENDNERIHSQLQNQSLEWVALDVDLPKNPGKYWVSDGERQCLSFFNVQTQKFSTTGYFDQPLFWTHPPKPPKKKLGFDGAQSLGDDEFMNDIFSSIANGGLDEDE